MLRTKRQKTRASAAIFLSNFFLCPLTFCECDTILFDYPVSLPIHYKMQSCVLESFMKK